MSASQPKFAILFWYYKELSVCVDRVRMLRRLNPETAIYGLYGGNPEDFPQYRDMLSPWLNDNWAFQEDYDAQWKWRHGDRMISAWFIDQGQHFDWDTLIVMQWDMLALDPVKNIFGQLRLDEIWLPGWRRLDEIESRFWWTRPGTEVHDDYLQFKAWIKEQYQFDSHLYACQFVAAALPRTFLDRYAAMPSAELGFLEYKMPTCAIIFGTPYRELPHLPVHWFDTVTPNARYALTTCKEPIPDATIAAEALNRQGARLFHPVTRKFPAGRSGFNFWLGYQAALGLKRRFLRFSKALLKKCTEQLKALLPASEPATIFPSARRKCDLVIIFAAADGERLGIEDLLDSFRTYLNCDYEVVAADDATTDGTYEYLLDTGCWVVRNPEKRYLMGLDLTLRRGLLEACRLFDSPIYLKIDPDALVIDLGLEDALRNAFKADPGCGLLGTYHVDWNGELRDLSYWRERMLKVRRDLGAPFDLAIKNGYEVGDGVQGGAYAISRDCLESMIARGWLTGDDGYRPSGTKERRVAEDSLFTMLTYAAGYKAVDIGGPEQPFALWDVGLPMSPEELVRQGRIVTHAMKYKDEVSLAAREFFRERRIQYRLTRSR